MSRCSLVSRVLALAIFAACPLAASASQLLYEQPRRDRLGNGYFWYTGLNEDGTGWKALDNVRFDTPVTIDGLDWTGFWATLNAGDPAENAEGWLFAVHEFAADGGVGPQVHEQYLEHDDVTGTYLGRTTIFDNPIYEEHFTYEARLTPVLLDAGEYWLSIRGDRADESLGSFAWDPAKNDFGDNVLRHGRVQNGNFVEKIGDRAFALYGTAVPEPSSMAIIGLAMMLPSVCSRRIAS